MNTKINSDGQSPFHTKRHIILTLSFLLLFSSICYCYPADKRDGTWLIVIDPGHGGSDPGALGSKSKEKDITLAVSLLTGKYLTENMSNVRVMYTRDKDVSVDLLERPKIANRNEADLFISIHANSVEDKNVRNKVSGTETYIMGLAKDKASLEAAMRENKVIMLEEDYSTKYSGFDPQSPESYIIFTLTHNLYQGQSTELASKVQSQFRERVGRKDRGVKQAGYWVLFNTTMPSVLIELGFISNSEEEKFMTSTQGQEFLASAIFRACRDYINEIDRKSAISIQEQASKTVTATTTNDDGTISFMVQVLTSSTRLDVNPVNFNGLNDITEIAADGRYKYAAGNFDNYEDAVKYRKKLESTYPDAFVIALSNNKILPLQQALEKRR